MNFRLQTFEDDCKNESMKELLRQSKKINFGVGMRCITVVMYLAENLEKYVIFLLNKKKY